MTRSKWAISAVVAAAVALAAGVGVSSWGDTHAGSAPIAEPQVDAALMERGADLARQGDCAACHSVAGKPEFSGGLRMVTPVGAIYTTNITPDPDHGIGRFSLTDFDRALRFGVAKGHSLYPAMPFTSYATTRPEDVAALYAYFKHGVAPAAVADKPSDIPFPISMRWPLTFWRWMFAPEARPFVASNGDPALARGEYFVNGMGHCGECHTPRAIAMDLKALKSSDGAAYLSGATIEGYFAPSLRSGGAGTLADWSAADLAEFLSTGTNRQGTAFGSMTDVVVHSTQHLSPANASDAAKYLKSIVDPVSGQEHFAYDKSTDAALHSGVDTARGARVYLDNCASCHRPDGKGYERVFPPLAGNPIVRAPNPSSVISVVLKGDMTPGTPQTPAQFAMPSFAWRLSDQDIADVATFVRQSWGNTASPVDADAVKLLRPATLKQSSR